MERFNRFFGEIVEDSGREYDETLLLKVKQDVLDYVESRETVEAEKLFDLIIRASNDQISAKNPEFTYLSASTLRRKLYKQASQNRGYDYKEGYGDYVTLVHRLVEDGIYEEELIKKYTKEELNYAGKLIEINKDKMFDYAGLYMLNNSFLKKDYDGTLLELPQERFVTVALSIMQDEGKESRMKHVEQAYWAMSNHLIGLATPSLMNAGSPHGSLSSCHIITPDDDLRSIFKSFEQAAQFSQEGSGLGIYMGYLRASGSWIRGYKGRSTGIMHPSRIFSTMAEYVDQLGARVAGIALYLPVWHRDIFDFLDLRLKTGSQERRAHSIKTAVNLPDEFMRRIDKGETWTTFDPYEFKKKMGLDINRLYDKKLLKDGETPNEQDHAFTFWYREAEKRTDFELSHVVKASEIYRSIFSSRKTSGTPYLYWSDTAARMNPNSHAGIPLGSNLCSEIIQNMSPDTFVSEELQEDGAVIAKIEGDGLVTCNLSSLVLNNVFTEKDAPNLQDVIDIQYRMLDNVISLNKTPVAQATHTNNLYRAVGGGAMGLVTLLTDRGIKWESNEAADFTGKIFKKYLQAAIEASHKLALEKGSYQLFEGSEWQTGEFFDKRGFMSDEWTQYREMAGTGLRNAYLMAIAPTATNSLIMNSSPCIDPPYEIVYREEKSGLSVLYVPSNYNNKTKWYYKSGFEMDEMWAINIVATAQRFVDQGISHNMHVSTGIKGSEMLRLDMGAWKRGLRTIYYTFTSGNGRADDCIMCSS